RQPRLPRQHRHRDDRQRHRDELPPARQLPGGGLALDRAHGGDRHPRRGLREAHRHGGSAVRFGVGKWGLGVYAVIALVLLLVPIAYTVVFSFNDSRRSNIIWRGFTFDNYLNLCDDPVVCESFANSLIVAGVSTVVATALGTAIAIALARYRFRFRTSTTLLLFLPMATPEVVLGAGLAAQFLAAGVQK